MCCDDQLTVAAESSDATMLSCKLFSTMKPQAVVTEYNWDLIWNNIDELNFNCDYYVRYEPLLNAAAVLGDIKGKLELALLCVDATVDIAYITIRNSIKFTVMILVVSNPVMLRKFCYSFDNNNYHRPSFESPKCMNH